MTPQRFQTTNGTLLPSCLRLGPSCTHFGERNENEDTIEFFDEAWILMKSAEGKAVIKNMRRIGRSKNNTLALITQSVHDAANRTMTRRDLGLSLPSMKNLNVKISSNTSISKSQKVTSNGLIYTISGSVPLLRCLR